MQEKSTLIIGAGLCGSLLALRLAQKGYQVKLIEKRPDLRKTEISAGRSINLALSNRGLKAMKLAGIEEKVKELCIPMHGRMIHQKDRDEFLSPYSGLTSEYINSISRTGLNALLLNEAEKLPNVEILFNHTCLDVDLVAASAMFKDETSQEKKQFKADVIFGADGAGSVVRKSMWEDRLFLFSLSQNFLTHGYKELSIPPTKDGGYRLEKNALHIWPRGENMVIALPNLDGSFTVTLFMAYEGGEYNLNNLNTPEKVDAYFKETYPSAHPHMPTLTQDFFENPTSPLGTVKCYPWSCSGKTLLIGDAAHAIVPFYGQGMNASFEDVVVLDKILDENPKSDWKFIFDTYQKKRKADADAIADLAIDNFHEMKSHTAAKIFQQKRKIETALEQKHPKDYASKYRLVTFREDLGYNEAMKKGRAQDKAILSLLNKGEINTEMNLEDVLQKINQETQEILNEDAILSGM